MIEISPGALQNGQGPVSVWKCRLLAEEFPLWSCVLSWIWSFGRFCPKHLLCLSGIEFATFCNYVSSQSPKHIPIACQWGRCQYCDCKWRGWSKAPAAWHWLVVIFLDLLNPGKSLQVNAMRNGGNFVQGEMSDSSPPGQNCHCFADDIFRCIFVNENFRVSINKITEVCS